MRYPGGRAVTTHIQAFFLDGPTRYPRKGIHTIPLPTPGLLLACLGCWQMWAKKLITQPWVKGWPTSYCRERWPHQPFPSHAPAAAFSTLKIEVTSQPPSQPCASCWTVRTWDTADLTITFLSISSCDLWADQTQVTSQSSSNAMWLFWGLMIPALAQEAKEHKLGLRRRLTPYIKTVASKLCCKACCRTSWQASKSCLQPSWTSWWASQIEISHPKPALKGVGGQVPRCGKCV